MKQPIRKSVMKLRLVEEVTPGEIIELHHASNGELFSMTEINPDCFEWKGKKYKLELTTVYTDSKYS